MCVANNCEFVSRYVTSVHYKESNMRLYNNFYNIYNIYYLFLTILIENLNSQKQEGKLISLCKFQLNYKHI